MDQVNEIKSTTELIHFKDPLGQENCIFSTKPDVFMFNGQSVYH